MTQSILTAIRHSCAPATPARVMYLPEVHSFGQVYFPELKASDTTKAMLVADIASAQHEEIGRVIAVDVASGKSWDASAEIARDVLRTMLDERGEIPRWCLDFLEEHLGVATVALAQREAA